MNWLDFLVNDMPREALNTISAQEYNELPNELKAIIMKYKSSSQGTHYNHKLWRDFYHSLSELPSESVPKFVFSLKDIFRTLYHYRKEQLEYKLPSMLLEYQNRETAAHALQKIYNPSSICNRVIKPWHYNLIYLKIAKDMANINIRSNESTCLIEIGTFHGGSSLMMSAIFDCDVISLDIANAEPMHCSLSTGRMIQYEKFDQEKPESIVRFIDSNKYENFIFIDDGSHMTSHQVNTFKAVLQHINPELYIIEDTYYQNNKKYNPSQISLFMETFAQFSDDVTSKEKRTRLDGTEYSMTIDHGLWSIYKNRFKRTGILR